jgi:hypothetical protein
VRCHHRKQLRIEPVRRYSALRLTRRVQRLLGKETHPNDPLLIL